MHESQNAAINFKDRRDSIDVVLDMLAAIALFLLMALPAYYYSSLPDIIPTHYGIDGEADAYGSKSTILLLPGVGLLLFVLMRFLMRMPENFNYIEKINEENKERQYLNALKLLRYVNAIITSGFAFIIYQTIHTANGSANGLGSLFTITFLVLVLGGSLYFVLRSQQKA